MPQLRVLLLSLIVVASGCATPDFDYPRDRSIAFSASEDTLLRKMNEEWASENPGPSGFYPLVSGNDAFGARLWLIQAAEKSIDAQYFLMKGDAAGRVFTGHLLAAADRGVRVRFLLDDIFTTVADEELLLIDAHPNIEVRLYNPISRRGVGIFNFLGDFNRANRRMHNKSFTADNQVTVVGGRNIADEYFELKQEGEFKDLDILGIGPVAKAVSAEFDNYWNHGRSLPIEALGHGFSEIDLEVAREAVSQEMLLSEESIYRYAINSTLVTKLIDGERGFYSAEAELISDDPTKLDESIASENMILVNRLDEIIRAASTEVIALTPYLVPGKAGVQFWKEVVESGTRVIIVTNSLASNNHTAVHGGYARYRKDLINIGVELYEARVDAVTASGSAEALTLHTKGMIIDREQVFIGSLNLDPRSIEINTEMGLMIQSAEMGSNLAANLLDDLNTWTYRVDLDDRGKLQWRGVVDGTEVTETSEPQASGWLKFKAWFLKIAPESQL